MTAKEEFHSILEGLPGAFDDAAIAESLEGEGLFKGLDWHTMMTTWTWDYGGGDDMYTGLRRRHQRHGHGAMAGTTCTRGCGCGDDDMDTVDLVDLCHHNERKRSVSAFMALNLVTFISCCHCSFLPL